MSEIVLDPRYTLRVVFRNGRQDPQPRIGKFLIPQDVCPEGQLDAGTGITISSLTLSD